MQEISVMEPAASGLRQIPCPFPSKCSHVQKSRTRFAFRIASLLSPREATRMINQRQVMGGPAD
ncbi:MULTISPECIES: hypothetical protein [unclassified Bradyrhizobium]|uniref:hypothetical protein n=1 Tax=unclassified Bradyrhizobium TaxID=2631580 RepID=UPI0024E12E86|nr:MULTISPECIES: hypothetical protein [unclassified Bradyrhizobium]